MKNELKDFKLSQEKLSGIWRGVVEDNNDPLKAGRCKIRVVGLHTDNKDINTEDYVSTENLIWAQPCIPIFGGISRVGMFGVPCQGAHVFLFFENKNIMAPRYFATAPGYPTTTPISSMGFNDPDGIYPSVINQPDWARIPSDSNYNDCLIISDKAGNSILFDSTDGNEKIVLTSKGQGGITIDEKGGIIKNSGDSTDITKAGAQEVVISGDSTTLITGNEIKTTMNNKESILGDKKTMISGTLDQTVVGTENKTSGGSSWNIKGDSDIMTGGSSSNVTDGTMSLKTNSGNLKLQATLLNIQLKAAAGNIDNQSLTYSVLSTLTAEIKGLVSTTIGGGILSEVNGLITTIKGTALTQIQGGIIMLG